MKDDAYKVCPKKMCRQEPWGKGPVRRLLGIGAGLIFKGSGFYITDYRSSGYKEAAKKDSGTSDGDSAKSSSGNSSTKSSGSSSSSGTVS